MFPRKLLYTALLLAAAPTAGAFAEEVAPKDVDFYSESAVIEPTDSSLYIWPIRLTGDVNGDGRDDFIGIHPKHSPKGALYVFPGGSNGYDFDKRTFLGDITYLTWDTFRLGDVTGDGYADLVAIHTRDKTMYVIPGTASGSFDNDKRIYLGSHAYAAWPHRFVGDVTGDGHADFVAVNPADGGGVYVVPGTASGFNHDARIYMSKITYLTWKNFLLADVTGDGHADLVPISNNNDAYIIPGTANGFDNDARRYLNDTRFSLLHAWTNCDQPAPPEASGWEGFWDDVKSLGEDIGDWGERNGKRLVKQLEFMGEAVAHIHVELYELTVATFSFDDSYRGPDPLPKYKPDAPEPFVPKCLWRETHLADVTGDGHADLVHLKNWEDTGGNFYFTIHTYVGLTGEHLFETLDNRGTRRMHRWDKALFSDVNGDGRADLTLTYDNSAMIYPNIAPRLVGAGQKKVKTANGGISRDNVYYYWYEDGTYLTGIPRDIDYHRATSTYSVATDKTPSDVIDIGIFSTYWTFAWYKDGTGSAGSTVDLDKDKTFTYALPSGLTPADIVAIGVGTDDKVYTWYQNNTFSIGTAYDLDAHAAPAPFVLPANRRPRDIVGVTDIYGPTGEACAYFINGQACGTTSDFTTGEQKPSEGVPEFSIFRDVKP